MSKKVHDGNHDRMETWQASPTDAPAISNEPTAEEMAEAMGIQLGQLADALALTSAADRRQIKRQVKHQRALKALGQWKEPFE